MKSATKRRAASPYIAAGLLTVVLGTAAAAPVGSSLDNPLANICHAEQRLDVAGPTHLEIQPGVGDGGFTIRANPQGQAWFNYGIALFHAFYHDDAKTAFDKAVAADPDCSMCLWGQALSRGSNQNFDAKPDSIADGLAMAKKAKDKARTPMEQALAEAMIARLEAKPDAAAETTFAQAVLVAARDQPDAIDLPLLASEADLTAWRRGDKAGGDKAEAIITPILKQRPDNTAAIHYYIHATEFAGHATLALPYAQKLAGLAPNASHLVHMAAHTFFHAGLYEDAAIVNARALAVDADHLRETGHSGPAGTAFYYPHNQGFGEAGALMSGDGTLAVRFADDLKPAFPASSFADGGLAPSEGRGYVAYGRYAPERMLTMPAPGADRAPAQVMYHYGRGEALTERGDVAGVRREAEAITGTSPQAEIARAVLAGRAAMLTKDYAAAAKAFSEASEVQGQMFSNQMDPPPWWYFVRRSVAAAKLASRDYKQARNEAQASLAVWPNDPLALLVLARAEARLGDRIAAKRDLVLARKAWHGRNIEAVPVDLI
jgi:tetratricopeptide (TPR) repeat protein